jgi:hypothetical protein
LRTNCQWLWKDKTLYITPVNACCSFPFPRRMTKMSIRNEQQRKIDRMEGDIVRHTKWIDDVWHEFKLKLLHFLVHNIHSHLTHLLYFLITIINGFWLLVSLRNNCHCLEEILLSLLCWIFIHSIVIFIINETLLAFNNSAFNVRKFSFVIFIKENVEKKKI